MACRNAIRGALNGFLGTYTSRYSDFGGYWLFGLVANELRQLQIDLLAPHDPEVERRNTRPDTQQAAPADSIDHCI